MVGLVELFGDDAIVDAGAQHGAIAVVVAHVDLREHHIVGVRGRVVGLSTVIRIQIGAVLDGALLGIADGAGLRHLALADHHAVGATNGVIDRQGVAGLLEQAHGGLLIAGERIATLICGVIVGAPLVGGNRNIDISLAFIRRDRGEEVGGIRRGVLQRDEHIQVVGRRDCVAVRVKLQPHLVALLKLRVQLDGRGRLILGLLIAHEVIAGDGVVARLRGRIGGRKLICVADADADIEQSGVKRQFTAHFLLVRVDHRKLRGAGLLAVDFRGQDAVRLCSFRRINRSDAVGDGRALALAALLGQGRQDVILTLLQRRSDRFIQRLLVVAIEVNGNIVILAVAQRDLLQVNGDIPLGLAEVDLVQIGRHGAVGQLGAAGARDGIRQGQTGACGRDDIQVKRLAACVVVFAASVCRGEVFNRGVVVLGGRAGIQLGQGVAGVVAVLHGNQQIITVCDGIIRNRIHGAAHRQRRNLLQLHGGGGIRLVAESIAEVQLRAFNRRAVCVNRAQAAVVLHRAVAVGGRHRISILLGHQEDLELGIADHVLFIIGTIHEANVRIRRNRLNRLGRARFVALGQGRDKAILGIVGQPRIDIVVATQERGASDQRIRGIQVFHVDRGSRRFLQHDVRLAADILDRHFILADGGAGGIGGTIISLICRHNHSRTGAGISLVHQHGGHAVALHIDAGGLLQVTVLVQIECRLAARDSGRTNAMQRDRRFTVVFLAALRHLGDDIPVVLHAFRQVNIGVRIRLVLALDAVLIDRGFTSHIDRLANRALIGLLADRGDGEGAQGIARLEDVRIAIEALGLAVGAAHQRNGHRVVGGNVIKIVLAAASQFAELKGL